MAEIIIMPKLGFNMDEGQLVKWHRRVGETVKKGEVLFEINTDKTTMPVEATEDGTLLKIILEEGAFAEVFTPIAVTGAPGEDPDAALASAGQGQAGGSAPAAAPSAIDDARAALLSMGFSPQETDVALSGYDGQDMRVEDLLGAALKRLGMDA